MTRVDEQLLEVYTLLARFSPPLEEFFLLAALDFRAGFS